MLLVKSKPRPNNHLTPNWVPMLERHPKPQYVGRFNEHGRMYGKVFSCYFIELQLLHEIFQEI